MGAALGAVPLIGGATAGAGGLGTILQVGFGIFSAISQLQAGAAEADAIKAQSEAQARQVELQAAGEKTQSQIDAAERARRLRVTLAQQNALFSASGALPTSGSFTAVQAETQRLGERELKQGLSLSRINQVLLKRQAQGFRASGEAGAAAAKSAGRTAAVGTIGGTLISVARRGSVPRTPSRTNLIVGGQGSDTLAG